MCFILLPELDAIRGIILLNGLAAAPAILFPLCGSDVKKRNATLKTVLRKTFDVMFDGLVVVAQLGIIPLLLLTKNFLSTSQIGSSLHLIIITLVGMVLVSLSWWENFVDDRFFCKMSRRGGTSSFILATKYDLQESRPIVTFFISFVKIGITILGTWLTKEFKPYSDVENANAHAIDSITFAEAIDKINAMGIKENSAILTLTLAAFVGHYFGYIACKLKLQRISFNIPLMLATPMAVVLVSLNCDRDMFSPFTTEIQNPCSKDELWTTKVLVYFTGFFLWLSLYRLGRYIFFPNIERLAKAERLAF